MKRVVKAALLLVLIGGALAAALLLPIISRGLSARDEPTKVEEFLARRLRSLAMPRAARDQKNPVTLNTDVLAAGRAHFADHCAACHANNGSGETQIGRNLYPKASDLREAATQSLSDGELFYIIENGIRLTGMPAWGTGTADGAEASWHLVHFIRHLPKLTAEELAEMEDLNPKSPAEMRGEEGMRKFLEGAGEAPRRSPTPPHRHPGGTHD